MSPIKTVAVLGASGPLGNTVVTALLKAGFEVTVVIRPGGRSYQGSGVGEEAVQTRIAAYDNIDSLTLAFQGQDAVVEAFNPAANAHQRTIVRAALAASVKHLITNEFGFDTFHPGFGSLPHAQIKVEANRILEEELKAASRYDNTSPFTWTGIVTGVWYDFGLRKGLLWMDPKTRTVKRYGSGNQTTNFTRQALNGEAVVAVLREPERYRNRPAYFVSKPITTNDLIRVIREISSEPWSVVEIPDVEAVMVNGMRLWNEDTKNGVQDRLNSKAYPMMTTAAIFDEENRYGADVSDKLESEWIESDLSFKAYLKELFAEVEGQ